MKLHRIGASALLMLGVMVMVIEDSAGGGSLGQWMITGAIVWYLGYRVSAWWSAG